MKSKLKIQETRLKKGIKTKVFSKKLPDFRNLFINLSNSALAAKYAFGFKYRSALKTSTGARAKLTPRHLSSPAFGPVAASILL